MFEIHYKKTKVHKNPVQTKYCEMKIRVEKGVDEYYELCFAPAIYNDYKQGISHYACCYQLKLYITNHRVY